MPKKGHRNPAKGSAQQVKQHQSQHGSRQQSQRGQCRIIAGKWRGRKIHFNDADGLRPTTDRIRETVFNWLQAYLPNSYCLDCFAGSGVLGFEAISRGAHKVVFIEQNKQTADKLKENARMLQADNTVIVNDDALNWLELISLGTDMLDSNKLGPNMLEPDNLEPAEKTTDSKAPLGSKFDLVFLDPPFRTDILQEATDLLNRSGCLTEGALIYVERSENDTVIVPVNWACLKQKHSGQVMYTLYQMQTGSDV